MEPLQEENRIENTDPVEDTAQGYIQAIAEMKQNSVSKEAYNKLKAENKQLLDSLINGGQVNMQSSKPEVDIQALRRELYTEDNSMPALEYVSKTLELRDALIEKGERDPFLPIGQNITPSSDDVAGAEKFATIARECVEYADGDSEVFINELQRRTVDAMPIRSKTTNRR